LFKLDNKIGLGLAALGRPGYINIGHDDDLGSDKSKASMRDYCHQVLDFAYNNGVRYFDTARVYGDAEEFLSSWIRKQSQFNGFVGSKWGYEYLANWEVNVDKHERKDHSAAFLKQQWVETRMNLGKNVDLYHIHSVTPDSSVLDDPTVIKELEIIKKNGLEIVGITLTSGSPDNIKSFMDSWDINYTILTDIEENETQVVTYNFGKAIGQSITGIPTTLIIDRDGYIVKGYIGPRTEDIFYQDLKPYL